jgi:HD-like signal output (HDOD) protein
MLTSSDLVKRLDTLNFPSAPEVVTKLSQLLAKEYVTGDALAEVMALDAGITARALRLANSVVFRGGGGVKSIPEAVLRVGIDGVRDIVFALSVVRALKPVHFDYRPFWRHSLAVAQATQLLRRRSLNFSDPCPEAYPAGLLHDIGMLVMDRTVGADYRRVLDQARTQGRPLRDVEKELLGTDHADVGGRLLETWRLPPNLVSAVRMHHQPTPARHGAVSLVHLADFVCNREGVDHGTHWRPVECSSEVWNHLGIAEADLPAIAGELQNELEHADAILAEA